MGITVAAAFTQAGGAPAGGLALAEIGLHLVALDKSAGTLTVVWDGSAQPSAEVAPLGVYVKPYAEADLDAYDYFAAAQYLGTAELDATWMTGVISRDGGLATEGVVTTTAAAVIAACARVGRGSVHYKYTVTSTWPPHHPLGDVTVEVYTDPALTNMIRQGVTDSFGVVWFWLDPGVYYFKCSKDRVRFTNPDVEEVVA
jgi:hypothetical protein